MPKRMSAAAIMALKDALCSIYWYKSDLRSFLQNSLSNTAILATLNWDNYKRQIVSDLIDYLVKNPDKHLNELTRLCYEVCEINSFDHLTQLDGGQQKADKAKRAVKNLKDIVKPHQNKQADEEQIKQRQMQAEEKLKSNAAVKLKLEEIKISYTKLIISSDSQDRGFKLEAIMYELFELFDLDPKASFRNTGEQIDGGFSLEGTEYLFEAKWHKDPIAASPLDSFSAKVKRKLDNTLGVFLSINGYSSDGVKAHSAGRNSIILLDGADLMAVFEGRIDFVSLLIRKKRYAAQTGNIYLQIHKIL